MSWTILIANVLVFVAFIAHTIWGDKDLRLLEPSDENENRSKLQEKWMQTRAGWHWVSFDLLFVSVALFLVNFTDWVPHEKFLIQLIMLYLFGWGLAWLIALIISKNLPNRLFKLGQWILVWLIGFILYLSL